MPGRRGARGSTSTTGQPLALDAVIPGRAGPCHRAAHRRPAPRRWSGSPPRTLSTGSSIKSLAAAGAFDPAAENKTAAEEQARRPGAVDGRKATRPAGALLAAHRHRAGPRDEQHQRDPADPGRRPQAPVLRRRADRKLGICPHLRRGQRRQALDLLRGVDLYKVGHHGSRNATPRTLFNLWTEPRTRDRKMTALMSTKPGVFPGKPGSGTEVPRQTLAHRPPPAHDSVLRPWTCPRAYPISRSPPQLSATRHLPRWTRGEDERSGCIVPRQPDPGSSRGSSARAAG